MPDHCARAQIDGLLQRNDCNSKGKYDITVAGKMSRDRETK